jgi:acetylornithine deacetylase/succinyl-diaminopimelate desuccinylase-like protein
MSVASSRHVRGGAKRQALLYARHTARRFLAELETFCGYPTISGDRRRADDIQRCARWLVARLRDAGLGQAYLIQTAGSPIVYGEWMGRRDAPVLLIYGHYDVQPVAPLNEWRTPPFQATVRGEHLYARGASDDKGQLFTHVKAIESFLRTSGRLPVNVRVILEGEEEIGSPHLSSVLTADPQKYACDVAVMSDTRMLGKGRPAITYALRGSVSLELDVRAGPRDLHAGYFGGAVANPIIILSQLLAGTHDRHGRVAVPGFYDDVKPISSAERRFMRRHGPTDEEILRNAQTRTPWGEAGFSPYERTTIRPALIATGIEGGYAGPGSKSIVPARAGAKVNVRLVPEQDPQEVASLLRNHLVSSTPRHVSVSVRQHAGARAVELDRRHWAMGAAATAYRRAFGARPVFLRSGGTIPVVGMLQDILGVSTVLMGFGLPDDRIHAPNEKFYIPHFTRGIEASLHFMTTLAQAGLAKAPPEL